MLAGWGWALLGGLLAVSVEAYFRGHLGLPWWRLWPGILGGLGVNYAIFRLLQGETLIGAFVLFAATTGLARLTASLWLGEAVPTAQWIAYGLILVATAIKATAR